MWNFLKPAPHKDLLPEGKIDSTYKSLRWQVFVGIFIGYAGYYIVRKNFSMAMPFLTDPAGPYGFDKGSLSIVLSLNAVALRPVEVLDGERLGSQQRAGVPSPGVGTGGPVHDVHGRADRAVRGKHDFHRDHGGVELPGRVV